MQVAPLNTNVQREVSANIGLYSALRRTADFSKYVSDNHTPPPIPVRSRDPEEQMLIDETASQLYGSAYDQTGHIILVDRWQQNVQAQTDAFARKLGGLFRSEGIGTNGDIRLMVATDGSIRVKGDHPDKRAIEAYFFANPELAEEYQKISSTNDLIAQSKINHEYNYRWNMARNDSERKQLLSYFTDLLEQTKELGGHMVLARDSLTSEAMAYAIKVVNG